MQHKLNILFCLIFFCSIGRSQTAVTADSSLCDSIKKKPERYEGKATYYTPSDLQISFTKIYYNNKPTTYILLKAKGLVPPEVSKVSILLENNEQLIFLKEKIDSQPGNGADWNYSAFVQLSQKDIAKLAGYSIKTFKLNAHQETLSPSDQKLIKGYAGCIQNK